MAYQNVQQKQKLSLVRLLLRLSLILVTVLSGAALVLGYLASSVPPSESTLITFLGLGLSLLILWNVIILFYWLFKLRWWVLMPAISLLCGIGYWGDFVQIRLSKDYHVVEKTDKDKEFITIATYNVHSLGVWDDKATRTKIVDSITTYLKSVDADVICLQEYAYNHAEDSLLFAQAFDKWNYSDFSITSDYGNIKVGIAVKSRYPLHHYGNLAFEGSDNTVLMTDVIRAKEDTIHLYSCHLQTTEFNLNQPKGLSAMVRDDNTEEAVKGVSQALRRNFMKREFQADTLAQIIASRGEKTIVTGDFNDTPNSYVTTTIRGEHLMDSFREAGEGYGYSYRAMRKLFRIDYILPAYQFFRVVSYDSPNLEWSDHKPVVAKLEILKE